MANQRVGLDVPHHLLTNGCDMLQVEGVCVCVCVCVCVSHNAKLEKKVLIVPLLMSQV